MTGNERLISDCSGANCGSKGSQYKGSGLGIWTYENKGKAPKALKVSLSGLEHNQVTLMFSNLSEYPQPMPKGLVNRGGNKNPVFPHYQPNMLDPIPTDVTDQRHGPVERKTWKVPQMGKNNQADKPIDFPSTLRGETTIGQFTYKLWVADQEWTSHAQKTIPYLTAMLFGTPEYPSMLKQYLDDFAVQPWGNYPNTPDNNLLIAPDLRTINMVIAPNGGGAVQFFDSEQMIKSPTSNQALVVFAGSDLFSCKGIPEGLCLDAENRDLAFALTNNLLHELTHLIHYYHRAVMLGVKQRFEPWLEEAVAASHGYVVALSRFPHTAAYNKEFTSWFSGNYVCPLNSTDGRPGTDIQDKKCSQNYYKSTQAFLVFLVQQYGTGFYRELLKANGIGIDVLDEAIRSSGGVGFNEAFRRWGSTLALPDAKHLPAGYDYKSIKVGDYFLPTVNLNDFSPFRQLLPTLPEKIEPYSHLPLVDHDQSGHYLREIEIPSGVALTVYIN